MSPDWTGWAAETPEPDITPATPISIAPHCQPSLNKQIRFICPAVSDLPDFERSQHTGETECWRDTIIKWALALTFPIWLPLLLVWGLGKLCWFLCGLPVFLWQRREGVKMFAAIVCAACVAGVIGSPFLGIFVFVWLINKIGWSELWEIERGEFD